MKILVSAMAALLAAVIATPASAQTTATVSGLVQDASGGVLPGVRVIWRHVETVAVRETVTADDGRFTFGGLPIGPYEIRAELPGFRPLLRTGLQITVGEHTTLTLTLEVGATEEVTVRGGGSLLNTRSAELSFLVGERAIAEIPVNGRNFTDLMALQPTVNVFPHRDNGSVVAHGLAMSVNGQDPRANVYLLDGTLMNDFTNGPAGSAAGTALGMDTVREFRVQANAYSAEYGRNVGGQINAITRSGTNQWRGSAFAFHRNEALDARNYFDTGAEPPFTRNQFGGTIGGPIVSGRLFAFAGYEALRETLGRTVVTTVPDDNARTGLIGGVQMPIDPLVAPYLAEFPVANGDTLGGGLARFTFPFDQRLDQHFVQGRVDYHAPGGAEFFVRHTVDDTEQRLPTDYPQFPRAFVSRNQFMTAEYRDALSTSSVHTARAGYSRTRIGQSVEANTSQALTPFVPGRATLGAIDIGGLPRFGPQLSADVQLDQDVYSLQYDFLHSRGRHFLKVGGVAEHYRADEFNPTFSLGVFRFANLAAFLRNTPASFIGLTPDGDINRSWDWTLFGAYLQDDWQVRSDLTLNLGLRLEGSTMPVDARDIRMPDLLGEPVSGTLYDNPGATFSPRVGAAWDLLGRGRASVRAGYGLYHNLNNQQNLIVTVTNPPATPRVVIANPTFPVPPFARGAGVSVRPIQTDVEYPRVHMWNASVQHALGGDWIAMVGYAGARGQHLWRNADVNIPAPTTLADGTLFFPTGQFRPNRGFSAIELKSSDGDSWYRALILELRKSWGSGLQVQSSYTWSRAEDTTQNATFFSDSTSATTSAMPEFIPDYNKGLSDFHAEHNWVTHFVWQLPQAASLSGVAGALVNDWQISGIVRLRSGNPLTVFVQTNRSRSQWSPSLGPGTGPDRPSYAPGRGPDDAVTGNPDGWFDPTAFVLQPAGTFGDVGRNAFIGPDLRTVDLAISRQVRWGALGPRGRVDLRAEIFNVFNRANFGPPSLVAFSGTEGEGPLPSFGQIRSTITSARQMQIGVRVVF